MQAKPSPLTTGDLIREWSQRHVLRSESFLRAIPDLLFLIHRDGTYLDFHPTKDIRPYVPPSQFLGKHVLDILPREIGERCQHLIEQALATRRMQSLEYELSMDSGVCSYEARIVPAGVDEVLAVVREIAHTVHRTVGNRKAEAHFRKIIENSMNALAVVYSGTLLTVNHSLAALFGYPGPETVCGLPFLSLIAAEGRTFVEGLIRSRAIGQLVSSTYRTAGRRYDGSIFNIEIRESESKWHDASYCVLRIRELNFRYDRVTNLLGPLDDVSRPSALKEVVDSKWSTADLGTAVELERIRTTFGYSLTARELQVLTLIAMGHSTKQVAASLGIAYKTADAHRTSLMEKVGAHDIAKIVRFAIRFGLIEP